MRQIAHGKKIVSILRMQFNAADVLKRRRVFPGILIPVDPSAASRFIPVSSVSSLLFSISSSFLSEIDYHPIGNITTVFIAARRIGNPLISPSY